MTLPLPLEQEFQDALYHDLWLVQEAMATGPASTPAEYTPPAHRYLPHLRDALVLLTAAHEAAKAEIPKNLEWKLGMDARKHADSVETMARHEPEVRRLWLIDTLTHIVTRGIQILEGEGRPAPPPPNLKLAKMRRSA